MAASLSDVGSRYVSEVDECEDDHGDDWDLVKPGERKTQVVSVLAPSFRSLLLHSSFYLLSSCSFAACLWLCDFARNSRASVSQRRRRRRR